MAEISFRCGNFRDVRGKRELEAARVIEQERADQEIERIWRERVKANEERRRARRIAAIGRSLVQVFR
jgi:hypothetical protein